MFFYFEGQDAYLINNSSPEVQNHDYNTQKLMLRVYFFTIESDPKSSSESWQTANDKPDFADTNNSARAYNLTQSVGI